MRMIFELSGENPTLPLAELDCICTVANHRQQVALSDCCEPEAAQRLAMAHTVLEYLGECRPDFAEFKSLLADLDLSTSYPFAGRVKKVHAGITTLIDRCSQQDFERLIGTMIQGTVDLTSPAVEYRAILSEDRCYFGRVLYTINRGAYDNRNPGKRAFFHPGVMMPRIARALVNISCAAPGETLLDPFCGTGGILLEAGMLGIHTIGSDFDPVMVHGSRQNFSRAVLLGADAAWLPLHDTSVDAVVTDLPYGQSVSIRREDSMEQLYDRALAEIRRVLRPGRRAVVVTHRDISGIAEEHMTLLQKHDQRVHKSLTRRILVMKR